MAVTFKHATLPNGLDVIAEVNADAHSAAAGFFVKTGARDEATPIMGVSHFLEHMMFKGADDISADEINQRFDDMGARNNAYTSAELTCFYAHVLPERAAEATELLARMMRPALRQKDFDTEKGVILEEIAMYKDNPFWVLYEETVDRHYRKGPMGHRVLGTKESISTLASEQMREYFTQRYSADNTTFAAAGHVDFDALVAQLGELCADWRPTHAARDNARPPSGGGEFEMRDERVNRGYLIGVAEAPPIADDRRHAAALLAQVLGAPDNSRLHWALIEPGLAEEAQAGYDPHDGVGDFFVYASGDPGKLDDILEVIRAEIDGLLDSLTEDDLERLRSKTATAATVSGERPHDMMHRIGRRWTYLSDYRSLDEELAIINAVTLDEVRDLISDYPLQPTTVGKLLPK